jgi:hypothetical protein
VIKFVVDLLQVSGFLRVLLFPPPIKLTRHDITAIIVENGVKYHKPKPEPDVLHKKAFSATKHFSF